MRYLKAANPARGPATDAGGTFLVVPAVPDMLEAVASGTADVAAFTEPTIVFYEKNGDLPAGTAISKSWEEGPVRSVGFGVRKETGDLLHRINASLAKLEANGTVAKIVAEYGLEWATPRPY